jgi:hypothetical protein
MYSRELVCIIICIRTQSIGTFIILLSFTIMTILCISKQSACLAGLAATLLGGQVVHGKRLTDETVNRNLAGMEYAVVSWLSFSAIAVVSDGRKQLIKHLFGVFKTDCAEWCPLTIFIKHLT